MDIAGFIVTLLIGIACIVIGIMNSMGNVSMLHSYHRSRVSEEDIFLKASQMILIYGRMRNY